MAIKVTEEKISRDELLEEAKQILRRDFYLTETSDGNFVYEIVANYDDEISDEEVIKICDSNDPWGAFGNSLDEAYDIGADDIVYEIIMDVMNALEIKHKESVPEDLSYDLLEMIHTILPEEYYLKQEYEVPIFIDTGDANYDFDLNLHYPAYDGDFGEEIDPKASIRWLAKTQGYSETELREAMESDLEKSSGRFMESMYRELGNCVSDLNTLVFLTRMTLEDLIRLNDHMRKCREPNGGIIYEPEDRPDVGTVHISKDVVCGLYDFWNGGGSMLEIRLEKDIDLPIKYIYSALPDGGCGYSLDDCYGIHNSDCWKNVVTGITEVTED